MRTLFDLPRLSVVCLVLLAPVAVAGAADDQEESRKAALSLNLVLGDQAITEKIAELKQEPAQAKKLLAAALALHRQKESTFNYSAAIILATLAKHQKDTDAADLFYRRAIAKAEEMKSDRRLVAAYYEWINLLLANQKYADAEKACKQLLELKRSPEELMDEDSPLPEAKLTALRRLVMVYALQGKEDQAEKTLKPFVERAGDDLDILDIQGWLLRYQEKYDEALRVYEKLLAGLPKEARLDSYREDYQVIIGSLYGDLGNLDKAMEYLMPLLKKKPDDPGLNNDIGYMWATHDRSLDEAARMIRKALDKEPNNPSYLDSMGWVLFKQKQYAEAKKYLLQAVGFPRGNNTEILDHLGDVHAALGEKAEAIAAWKKAAGAATNRQRDQKRKAKIEEKLKQMQ
jgi:tetratricopeptide (TPR) repeat protein